MFAKSRVALFRPLQPWQRYPPCRSRQEAPNSRDFLGDRFGDKALCKSVSTAFVALWMGKFAAGDEATIDEIEAYPPRSPNALTALHESDKTPSEVLDENGG